MGHPCGSLCHEHRAGNGLYLKWSLHCMQSSVVLLKEGGIFAGWLMCTGLWDPHRPRASLIVWFCEFKETV